jgi:CubicO group peptidase (beta-lactamase class C family)
VQALRQIEEWPPETAAAVVLGRDGELGSAGPRDRVFRWASITKLLTALAVLVAAEEGTVDLDEPAGPEGSTVRHLLAHASGLPFDGPKPIARPGQRRIYSNTGYAVLGEHLAGRADMSFEEYAGAAVLEPLGLTGDLREKPQPAAGYWGTLGDLAALGRELLAPTLVAPETFAEATSVVFPGLVGVLPDFGRMEPLDWGLGFELRDHKEPHWTGSRNSPRTFGHFGGSGTFLWADPEPGIALGFLGDLPFDDWSDDAKRLWPKLSDDVLTEAAKPTSS